MKFRKTCSTLLCFALLAGCAGLVPRAADGGGYAPYRVVCTFYGDSATARAFHWYTKEDCGSDIRLEPPQTGKGQSQAATKFQGGYAHSVILSGLAPGTEYTYQVGDRSKNIWSAKGTFVTDAGPGKASGFVALTDVQADRQEDYQLSAKLLGRAQKLLGNKNSFFVHLGDYTNDCGNEQWDYFFNAYKPYLAQTTHAAVAGNHDGFLHKTGWFSAQFTLEKQKGASNARGAYYSFDWGDAHYAVLNTNDAFPMSARQLNWLQNDMRASGAKWKIIFLHKSLYSGGDHPWDPDVMMLRYWLLPAMDSLGIDLVMSGHDHMYYRSEPVLIKDEWADRQAKEYDYNLDQGWQGSKYFAPSGPVYILPNTAGPKEYHLNAAPPPQVKALAAKYTQPGQPVYTTVQINGGQLKYEAYFYDQASGKDVLMDQVIIEKKEFRGAEPAAKPLPTSLAATLPGDAAHLFLGCARLLWDYLTQRIPVTVKAKLAK
ncbi:MAG: metallophosphoesterase family protein [Oscillospiraceae bacterium]|jgi:hypothetical protein|nr:metallophosphoesterase family protein [Oscillospiraceae bacterium]